MALAGTQTTLTEYPCGLHQHWRYLLPEKSTSVPMLSCWNSVENGRLRPADYSIWRPAPPRYIYLRPYCYVGELRRNGLLPSLGCYGKTLALHHLQTHLRPPRVAEFSHREEVSISVSLLTLHILLRGPTIVTSVPGLKR